MLIKLNIKRNEKSVGQAEAWLEDYGEASGFLHLNKRFMKFFCILRIDIGIQITFSQLLESLSSSWYKSESKSSEVSSDIYKWTGNILDHQIFPTVRNGFG